MRAEPALRAADVAHCAAILRHGSKSFAMASRLLPLRVRAPATVLYAFCRVADDLVDDGGPRTEGSVASLRARLDRIYAGAPLDAPIDRALFAVVARFQIPRALPDALIEGLAWDVEARRYEDVSALHAYAARVAAAVGVMMTVLMGTRREDALARACDLGVAMQLTNIARDVGEDAARGRIYLPLGWMREEGLDPDAWLRAPVFDARVARVTARLLASAEVLYARADHGVPMLPSDCRVAIRAARLIYSDIGRVIARAGHDSVSRRAFVSKGRKLWLLLRSLPARVLGPAPIADPPLEEVRFLVRACACGARA